MSANIIKKRIEKPQPIRLKNLAKTRNMNKRKFVATKTYARKIAKGNSRNNIINSMQITSHKAIEPYLQYSFFGQIKLLIPVNKRLKSPTIARVASAVKTIEQITKKQ